MELMSAQAHASQTIVLQLVVLHQEIHQQTAQVSEPVFAQSTAIKRATSVSSLTSSLWKLPKIWVALKLVHLFHRFQLCQWWLAKLMKSAKLHAMTKLLASDLLLRQQTWTQTVLANAISMTRQWDNAHMKKPLMVPCMRDPPCIKEGGPHTPPHSVLRAKQRNNKSLESFVYCLFMK